MKTFTLSKGEIIQFKKAGYTAKEIDEIEKRWSYLIKKYLNKNQSLATGQP